MTCEEFLRILDEAPEAGPLPPSLAGHAATCAACSLALRTEGFAADLAAARGVIASAGLSLISECLHLKKKMLLLPLAGQYELLWTPARIGKVVEAAVKHRVALEISASYKLPLPGFLKQARAAGVKFSFGSNGRYPKMGLLDYSLAMAKELGLQRTDLFVPARDGEKAVQRRRY